MSRKAAQNSSSQLQPPTDEKAIHRLPGSSLALTQPQIDDLLNPPDWFPNQHPPAPKVVLRGNPPDGLACGSCHLMSGEGHPESAGFAGQPAAYIVRQMEYFKSGARKDYLGRMDGIAKAVSAEDVRQAAEWFAAMKPTVWTKVVEADMVPKSVVVRRMRLPAPGGGMEPLGNRIITLPQDAERVEKRDPHSGFIAYVPKGSLKKGEALVRNANSKTIQCAVCHGQDLRGIGDVPRIAGLHPIYVVRQLYGFKNGGSNGGLDQLMKSVVEKLNDDDILNVSAYVASVAP